MTDDDLYAELDAELQVHERAFRIAWRGICLVNIAFLSLRGVGYL